MRKESEDGPIIMTIAKEQMTNICVTSSLVSYNTAALNESR
jgi:hypothetical protein